MDLEYLGSITNEGREEIVKRTKNSLLSVKGKIYVHASLELLVKLITEDWERIEHFDVGFSLEQPSATPPFPKEIWNPCFAPSPVLKSFNLIRCSADNTENTVPSIQQLFGAVAPQLQSIVLHYPGFTIDLSAPWLSQLRHLKVLDRSLPLSSWLDALSTMPLLESLNLDNAILFPTNIEMEPSLSVARPPFLRSVLVCEHGVMQVCTFLDDILPAPGCGLQTATHLEPQPIASRQLGFINHVLSTYAESWFKATASVENIIFSMFGGRLYVSASASDWHPFSISAFDPQLSPLAHHSACPILDAFSNCNFSGSTTISLYSEINMPNRHLTLFLLLLSNITVLSLACPTFNVLVPESANTTSRPILFPNLSRVVLRASSSHHLRYWLKMCIRFFQHRCSIGHPVEIPDLRTSQVLPNLTPLDAIPGLQIKWRDENVSLWFW